MECADCHERAAASSVAREDLRPAPEICADCHEEKDLDLKYAEPAAQPTETAAAQTIADELIFSHKAHTRRGLDCDFCHRNDESAQAAVASATMETCFRCHEGRRGVEDCAICHSKTLILTPSDHDVAWISSHGEEARQDDEACLRCHNRDHCQECHEGGRPLPAEPLQTEYALPYGPQLAANGTLLERVHELNYRFTHPLDADGVETECVACHQYESFCSECHAPSDDPERFKPLWHGGPGWGAIAGAVGTGGGRHGEMAIRDIELCAACHEIDIAGTDQTCLECHRDENPGRGNDPSTHGPGFAGDLGRGEWHHDDGAVCYICHRRSEAGDNGFCGYCHGHVED